MNAAGNSTSTALSSRVLVLALVAALLVGAALAFASVQQIWIDETTQLSGATLDWPALMRWLAGESVPRFGVPGDRMPPLSYLVDSACWQTVCGQPFAFRILHLVIALGGVLLLVAAIHRRYGIAAALTTGLLLALSPRIISNAVEIRAYPIFFAITCAQIWQLLRIFERPGLAPKPLAGFILLSLLAAYTHFFGLVASCALLCGIAVGKARSWRQLVVLAVAGLAYLVLLAGLIPFFLAATALSGGPTSEAAPGVVEFIPQVLGHPAIMLWPVAAAGYFLGFAALLLITFLHVAREAMREPAEGLHDARVALFVALASGIVVVVAAAFVAKGFNTLGANYNIWMFPAFAALAGTALATPRPLGRAAQVAAAICLLGALWGYGSFVGHARWFAHGPGETLAAQVGADPARTLVVYDSDVWGFGYFPIRYRFGGRVQQMILKDDGRLYPIEDAAIAPIGVAPAEVTGHDRLVLAAIRLEGHARLRRLLSEEAQPQLPPEKEAALAAAGWQVTGRSVEPGLYWLDMATFERTSR